MKIDRLQAYTERLRASPPGSDLFLDGRGAVVGAFRGRTIGTALQPIHRRDGSVAGAQGLLRALDDEAAADGASWDAFTQAVADDELVALDRRCRAIHTLNFFLDADAPPELHLCVHDRLLTAVVDNHGRAFRRLVDALGVPAQRIVIDLPIESCADASTLAQVAANYALRGFKVAVNPPSAASLEALLPLMRVSIVKIDVQLWAGFASGDRDPRLALQRARDAGSTLLFKRIESAVHERLALDSGATLLQGHRYARPTLAPATGGWRAVVAPGAAPVAA